MTARVWAQTLKELDSLPFKEVQEAVLLIRKELKKFAPRLIKHSFADDATKAQTKNRLNISQNYIKKNGVSIENISDEIEISVDNSFPNFIEKNSNFESNFKGKVNRYSQLGLDIQRTFIRAGWNNIALAELRDLNRHRTGFRFSTLEPVGFYIPEIIDKSEVNDFLKRYKALTEKLEKSGVHYYSYLLGTQTRFEHSTHLDKFIYEIELRTGLGAHFRYAEHLKNAYDKLVEKFPEYRDYIEIGTAEPE
jgi:hypothetical protein